MSKTEEIKCPLCNETDEKFQFHAKDYLYNNEGSWRIVKCNKCKLTYINPRIKEEYINEFYPGNYYTNTKKTNRSNLIENLNKYILYKKFKYKKYETIKSYKLFSLILYPILSNLATVSHNITSIDKSQPTVLDIGCGNGWCLNKYKELGWKTFGTEITDNCVEIATTNGHKIYKGKIEDLNFDGLKFDSITMWDVFEHVSDPINLLKKIRYLMTNESSLYIYVPNYSCIYSKFFKDKWMMFTAPLHYFHYTKDSIERLLNITGFTVVSYKTPLGGIGLYNSLLNMLNLNKSKYLKNSKFLNVIFNNFEKILPGGHMLIKAKKNDGKII